MKKSLLLFFTLAFLSGCVVRGSHVLTGSVRPAIAASEVKVYAATPSGTEIIGTVVATITDAPSGQSTTDKLVEELKRQAALMGANGVLIGSQSVGTEMAALNGMALYVR